MSTPILHIGMRVATPAGVPVTITRLYDATDFGGRALAQVKTRLGIERSFWVDDLTPLPEDEPATEGTSHDAINPSHYHLPNDVRVIDIIDSMGWGEGFARGNAVKYILRAGVKNPETLIEDLTKARWYLLNKKETP